MGSSRSNHCEIKPRQRVSFQSSLMTSIPWRTCWLFYRDEHIMPNFQIHPPGVYMIVDSGRVRGVIDSVAAQLVLRVPGLDGT